MRKFWGGKTGFGRKTQVFRGNEKVFGKKENIFERKEGFWEETPDFL